MRKFAGYEVYKKESQAAVMVMTAVRALRGRCTKQEVLGHISEWRWFDVRSEDLPPYPESHTDEQRWKTFLAWDRESCAGSEFIDRSERGQWDATTKGLNEAALIRQEFERCELDVRKCYLWTPVFKKHMCSSYEPSNDDARRPVPSIWEDLLPSWRKSVRGNQNDPPYIDVDDLL